MLDYDTPPRPIKSPAPQYPQEAFIKKIEGTGAGRDPDRRHGRVVRARVVQSVPCSTPRRIQTVYQWAFSPAMKHGSPVATLANAPVAFRIF